MNAPLSLVGLLGISLNPLLSEHEKSSRIGAARRAMTLSAAQFQSFCLFERTTRRSNDGIQWREQRHNACRFFSSTPISSDYLHLI